MKIYVIKENKIIRQENEGYIAKDDETLISANDIDWLIKKRTGGEFLEINKNDIQETDIISGAVLKFKVKRNNEIIIIERSEKLETDELLEFIHPENMIRVYRGGTSILTIGTDFNHETEAIEHNYTKNELYILNGKAKVKTPEMQIVDIRDKSRVVLLQMAKDIDKLEKEDKPILVAANDWTDGDEAKLTDMKTDYQKAIEDYNEVKAELLAGAGSLEDIEQAKINVKPKLEKYKIKV